MDIKIIELHTRTTLQYSLHNTNSLEAWSQRDKQLPMTVVMWKLANNKQSATREQTQCQTHVEIKSCSTAGKKNEKLRLAT